MKKSNCRTSLPYAFLIGLVLTAVISTNSWSQQTPEPVNPAMDDFSGFLIMIMDQGRYGAAEVLKPSTIDIMLSPRNVVKVFQTD